MYRRPAQLHPSYADRLGHVTGLLDSLTEARLERVTRTAQRLFGVQSAAIWLWRGSRLAFVAHHGSGELPIGALLEIGQEATRHGAPRILAEAPEGGKLARAHGFIAISPLSVDRGLSGGCIALIDPRPLAVNVEDLPTLADLATWAEHEMEIIQLGQSMALRLA